MYKCFFKRLLGFVISFIAIILLGWFMLVIALILLFANKGAGVFFAQDRVGKDNSIFKVLKFKTMNDAKDEDGCLLPDNKRLTKIGRFIRSTSIDELPQLFNVLKGDMSLIGPRPLLVDYLPLYSSEQSRRHEVRPGITGWAQCNGRNLLSWKEKFKLDVWYVDNYTFLLDVKIIFLTIRSVLLRKGINSSSEVTMVRFDGST